MTKIRSCPCGSYASGHEGLCHLLLGAICDQLFEFGGGEDGDGAGDDVAGPFADGVGDFAAVGGTCSAACSRLNFSSAPVNAKIFPANFALFGLTRSSQRFGPALGSFLTSLRLAVSVKNSATAAPDEPYCANLHKLLRARLRTDPVWNPIGIAHRASVGR